jgi:hypothetical protein
MPIILDWALQLMYVHDQLLIIISSSGMIAMLGMGSVKAFVEAEVCVCVSGLSCKAYNPNC